MEDSHTRLLALVARLVDVAGRPRAAKDVAHEIGAEDLIIFIADAAVGAHLPAPGFPQTLPNFAVMQQFLATCEANTTHNGRVSLTGHNAPVDVVGVRGSGGSVAVLIGGAPHSSSLTVLAAMLPLLEAVFAGEHIAKIADSHAKMASQAAEQSRLLADSVDRGRIALRKALTEAEKANQAKDQFLASLSHELRTPLTPVLISACALREDENLPPAVHQQLAMMQQNLELEVRLIDDLLDLTRIANGKLHLHNSDCNVHVLLDHTVQILRAEIDDKQLDFTLACNASQSWVRGDGARLQQVFWNLLKNAVKFTPTGGRIAVETRNDAHRIHIIVQDSGRGIAPERCAAIFKPFEQGDVEGEHLFGGLGLGLAISKAVVDLHQGQLIAQSAGVAQGATFTVDLASIDTPDPTTDRKRMTLPTANQALRLLVVEDHTATLEALNALLCRSGYQVTTASTMLEAQQIASGESFDAVISDVGLPDGTGHELMRHLRAEYGLKGIALSGYGMEEDLRQSADSGFVAHLTKPIIIGQLRQTLRAHFHSAS